MIESQQNFKKKVSEEGVKQIGGYKSNLRLYRASKHWTSKAQLDSAVDDDGQKTDLENRFADKFVLKIYEIKDLLFAGPANISVTIHA